MDDMTASANATLPRLIEQAAAALATATTAAEVLDAKNKADFAYTTAKAAARFAEAKNAHDTIVTACRKAMGDALLIEKTAQCRLADEYDAAQDRGEVQKPGGDRKSINVPVGNNDVPTVEEIGLTRKQVHEARAVRDAQKKTPGLVQKTIEEKLKAGKEPTRADIKRAIAPAPAALPPAPLAAQTGNDAIASAGGEPEEDHDVVDGQDSYWFRRYREIITKYDELREEFNDVADCYNARNAAMDRAGLMFLPEGDNDVFVTVEDPGSFSQWLKDEQAGIDEAFSDKTPISADVDDDAPRVCELPEAANISERMARQLIATGRDDLADKVKSGELGLFGALKRALPEKYYFRRNQPPVTPDPAPEPPEEERPPAGAFS